MTFFFRTGDKMSVAGTPLAPINDGKRYALTVIAVLSTHNGRDAYEFYLDIAAVNRLVPLHADPSIAPVVPENLLNPERCLDSVIQVSIAADAVEFTPFPEIMPGATVAGILCIPAERAKELRLLTNQKRRFMAEDVERIIAYQRSILAPEATEQTSSRYHEGEPFVLYPEDDVNELRQMFAPPKPDPH